MLTRAGFREEQLVTVEPEPSYLVFSTPSFLLGVAYERLVNRVAPLAGVRACLFGCFRKDGAPVRAPAHVGPERIGRRVPETAC